MKSGQKKLKDLAADYFLRELNDEEMVQLQEGMDADPELGAFFIEAARDEWLMNDYQEFRRSRTVTFPAWHRQKKRFQRIAAGIAVLLTLGGILVAQRTAVRLSDIEDAIQFIPVASVQEISVRPGSKVSAVNHGKVRAVKSGDALYDGDRIVVPTGGALIFQYSGESTTIAMGSGSRFAIADKAGAKRVYLTSGFLKAEVNKQPPDKPMKISTHDAEIVVVGTSFEIQVDQFTHLNVESGRVRFMTRADGQTIDVAAGMTTDSQSLALEGREVLSRILLPVDDDNIGLKNHNILHIDPKRHHQAFLKFDLGDFSGEVAEARLRLKVSSDRRDGGGGHVRLHSVPADATPENALSRMGKQLSDHIGRVEVGESLEFAIQPEDLKSGLNAMVVTLDKKWSDDIWFGSTETGEPPELILKMKKHGE